MPPKARGKSPAPKGSAKKGAAPKPGAKKDGAKAAPAKAKLTDSDVAVCIQQMGRAWMARLLVCALRQKHAAGLLEKLEEESSLTQMRYEKKRREAEAKIKKDMKTKAQREAELQERLFTASFDGELDDMRAAIKDKADVHKQDVHGNYSLGEAAVNGQTEAIRLLLQEGCDPNCKGAFGRTPLWRAAYNGHAEAISLLLESGADPRVESQAQTPEELCSGECKEIFAAWDVSKTDTILAKLQQAMEEREQARRADAEKIAKSLEEGAADAKDRYDAAKKQLLHARCDLERRIYEYDCVYHDPDKGDDLKNIALDLVKTAEKHVEAVTAEADTLEHEYLDARGRSLAHAQQELDMEEPGRPIKLTQLAEVVLGDQMSLYRGTPHWPLVIDCSGRAGVFLRYRDTNYLSTMHPHQMEPESIRRAIVGALRYGKSLVLDLCDVPMLEHAMRFFNASEEGLWEKVMSKRIVKEYSTLLRKADGPEYEPKHFTDSRLEDFAVVVLTSSRVIEDPLLETFIPFRIDE